MNDEENNVQAYCVKAYSFTSSPLAINWITLIAHKFASLQTTHKLFAFVANNYTHEVRVRLLLVIVLHVTITCT